MNKTKLTLAIVGGVFGVAALATAYLAYDAYAAKVAAIEGDDEGNDGLDTVVTRAETLSRKPIYPSVDSVKAVDGNRGVLEAWKDEAAKLAAAGDRVYPHTTPAAFKSFIGSDAKRLAGLPGGVKGCLMRPEFEFGPFKDYVVGGKMPADAELPTLQRQWDDFATVAELLSTSGVAEVTGLRFIEKKADDAQAKGKKKPVRKPVAKGKKGAEDVLEPSRFGYVITFETRQTGFAKALNALETSERFISVEDFSLTRGTDVIGAALGEEDKQKAATASVGRGRRRRGAAAAAAPEENKSELKNGIVTDPLLDAPFKVEMTVYVTDFRTLEGGDTEGADKASEEVKK